MNFKQFHNFIQITRGHGPQSLKDELVWLLLEKGVLLNEQTDQSNNKFLTTQSVRSNNCRISEINSLANSNKYFQILKIISHIFRFGKSTLLLFLDKFDNVLIENLVEVLFISNCRKVLHCSKQLLSIVFFQVEILGQKGNQATSPFTFILFLMKGTTQTLQSHCNVIKCAVTGNWHLVLDCLNYCIVIVVLFWLSAEHFQATPHHLQQRFISFWSNCCQVWICQNCLQLEQQWVVVSHVNVEIFLAFEFFSATDQPEIVLRLELRIGNITFYSDFVDFEHSWNSNSSKNRMH